MMVVGLNGWPASRMVGYEDSGSRSPHGLGPMCIPEIVAVAMFVLCETPRPEKRERVRMCVMIYHAEQRGLAHVLLF
jgi:hypothetical protein